MECHRLIILLLLSLCPVAVRDCNKRGDASCETCDKVRRFDKRALSYCVDCEGVSRRHSVGEGGGCLHPDMQYLQKLFSRRARDKQA
jgi:hypothetical protein